MNYSINNIYLKHLVKILLIILFLILYVFSYNSQLTSSSLVILISFLIIIIPICFTNDIFHPFIILAIDTILAISDFYFKDLEGRNFLKYSSGPVERYVLLGLMVFILWYMCFYFGYFIAKMIKHKIPKIGIIKNNPFIYPNKIIMVLYIFVILGFIISLLIYGGISGMIGAMEDPVKSQSGLAYLRKIVSLGATINLLFLYKREIKYSIFSLLITMLLLTFFGGRASVILGTLLPYLIVYNYTIKKISLKLIALLAFLGLLFVLAIGNFRAGSDNFYIDTNIINIIKQTSAATGRADAVPSLIGELVDGNIQYQYGKPLMNIIYAPIPRSIWEGKPTIIDETVLMGYHLLGSTRYWGLPTGPYGYAFFNFGWIGVMLFGLMTGYIVRIFYYKAILTRTSTKRSFLLVMIYSLLIRSVFNVFATSAQIKIMWELIILLALMILDKIVIKSNR